MDLRYVWANWPTVLIIALLIIHSSQYDYGGWMPNTPISLQLPPPTTKGTTSEDTMLQTFPDVNTTAQGMATMWLLSKQSSDFVSAQNLRKINCYQSHSWSSCVKWVIMWLEQEYPFEKCAHFIQLYNHVANIPCFYVLNISLISSGCSWPIPRGTFHWGDSLQADREFSRRSCSVKCSHQSQKQESGGPIHKHGSSRGRK